jgi:hypothetical protein
VEKKVSFRLQDETPPASTRPVQRSATAQRLIKTPLRKGIRFVGVVLEERRSAEAITTLTGACVPVPTIAFQALAIGQSIVSGLLIFFIALAQRNFFKLR